MTIQGGPVETLHYAILIAKYDVGIAIEEVLNAKNGSD